MSNPVAERETLTVLVVDDEPQIRRLVRNALTPGSLQLDVLHDDVPCEVRVLRGASHRNFPHMWWGKLRC